MTASGVGFIIVPLSPILNNTRDKYNSPWGGHSVKQLCLTTRERVNPERYAGRNDSGAVIHL